MSNIYISYAWKDNKTEAGKQREILVDRVCDKLISLDYKLIRDKNVLSLGQSIRRFMHEIGSGNYVIIVLSDKYLRSEYCMFEATEIMKSKKYQQHVFPVVLEDADIYSKEGQFTYIDYWLKQHQKVEQLMSGTFADRQDFAMAQVAGKIKEIAQQVGNFITFASDRLSINPASNFDGFIAQISDAIHRDIENTRGQKRILVAGTGTHDLPQEIVWCSEYLGKQIAENRYNLITGGWEGVDYIVADKYAQIIEQSGQKLSDKLAHVVPRGKQPVFRGGSVEYVSAGPNEWIDSLKKADLVILLGGVGGTYETYTYAKQENIPVIPIVCTSGDAKRVFDEMLQNWNAKLMGNISQDKFKSLNQFVNKPETAQSVVTDVMEIANQIIFARQALNL